MVEDNCLIEPELNTHEGIVLHPSEINRANTHNMKCYALLRNDWRTLVEFINNTEECYVIP